MSPLYEVLWFDICLERRHVHGQGRLLSLYEVCLSVSCSLFVPLSSLLSYCVAPDERKGVGVYRDGGRGSVGTTDKKASVGSQMGKKMPMNWYTFKTMWTTHCT